MIFETARRILPADVRHLLSRLVGRRPRKHPRYYVPAGTTVHQFFGQIAEARIKCVVLRWFDELPHVAAGEDIDMLVADEDLPALEFLLNRDSGSVPCDIYTASGLEGTQYKGNAYFPSALAASSLDRRIVREGLYPQPSPTDHFNGLAYHAIYQKGPASGIPSIHPGVSPTPQPEHDYAEVLADIARHAGLTVPIDMESIDRHLASEGCRPAEPVLRSLARTNNWVAQHFFS
jgi:hypothetical protein